MNLEEFYRQAQFLRNYTPSLSVINPAVITPTAYEGKFMVMGGVVVAAIRTTYTLSVANPFSIDVTMPTAVKDAGSVVVIPFFGYAGNIGGGGLGAVCGQAGGSVAPNKIRVVRYDNAALGIGSGSMTGIFIYENGE